MSCGKFIKNYQCSEQMMEL